MVRERKKILSRIEIFKFFVSDHLKQLFEFKNVRAAGWMLEHMDSGLDLDKSSSTTEVTDFINLVPRAARTSPSKDFTARSDSRSYLAHLDF